MKIRILSDLHLEFEPDAPSADAALLSHGGLAPSDADVVVLAGDIALGAEGVAWARATFSSDVVYVSGNHEHYGGRMDHVFSAMREAAGRRVHVLEDGVAVIERRGRRVRFIGCTLWTDFALHGHHTRGSAMFLAERGMSDYVAIRVPRGTAHDGPLLPEDTLAMHEASRAFLARALAEPFAGPTVVVTHMLPSVESVAQRWLGHALNAAFASDLDALIDEHRPALWIHGHTHDSCDYRRGPTRVVCNPRGYFPDEINPDFDPDFTVEIAG